MTPGLKPGAHALPQRAAEAKEALELRILSKAGRGDAERADMGGPEERRKNRLWARWFDPTTMALPADMCLPLQKPEVRPACPSFAHLPLGRDCPWQHSSGV